jgi:hypothetical protein
MNNCYTKEELIALPEEEFVAEKLKNSQYSQVIGAAEVYRNAQNIIEEKNN